MPEPLQARVESGPARHRSHQALLEPSASGELSAASQIAAPFRCLEAQRCPRGYIDDFADRWNPDAMFEHRAGRGRECSQPPAGCRGMESQGRIGRSGARRAGRHGLSCGAKAQKPKLNVLDLPPRNSGCSKGRGSVCKPTADPSTENNRGGRSVKRQVGAVGRKRPATCSSRIKPAKGL